MSEKKTKKPVEAAQEAAQAATKERKVREDNSKWEFVPAKRRTDEQNKVKVAPQAQEIINVLEAEGPMTRTELCANLSKSGALKTRQPVERILAYYKKPLTETIGAVKITTE